MNRELYRYSDMDVVRAYTDFDNYPKYNPIFSIPIFKRIKAIIIKRIQKDEYINMINGFSKRQIYYCDLYEEGTMVEPPCTTLHINRILGEVKHNWKLRLLTNIEVFSFYALIIGIGCTISYIVVTTLINLFK